MAEHTDMSIADAQFVFHQDHSVPQLTAASVLTWIKEFHFKNVGQMQPTWNQRCIWGSSYWLKSSHKTRLWSLEVIIAVPHHYFLYSRNHFSCFINDLSLNIVNGIFDQIMFTSIHNSLIKGTSNDTQPVNIWVFVNKCQVTLKSYQYHAMVTSKKKVHTMNIVGISEDHILIWAHVKFRSKIKFFAVE